MKSFVSLLVTTLFLLTVSPIICSFFVTGQPLTDTASALDPAAALVDAALASSDPRQRILALFFGIEQGFPVSWSGSVPIQKWEGVHVTGSSQNPVLLSIWVSRSDSSRAPLRGSLNIFALRKFNKLFPDLVDFGIPQHQLRGEFPPLSTSPSLLPAKLQNLDLSCRPPPTKTTSSSSSSSSDEKSFDINADDEDEVGFTGTLELESLPLTLKFFNIQHNFFENADDDEPTASRNNNNKKRAKKDLNWALLAQLKSLEVFWLASNRFSGAVKNVSSFPNSLLEFSISNNNFEQQMDLSALHHLRRLTRLLLDGNTNLGFFATAQFHPPRLDAVSIQSLSRIQVAVGGAAKQEQQKGGTAAAAEATIVLPGDEFYAGIRAVHGENTDAIVDAAIRSTDQRLKLLCLFSHVTDGLPASWSMQRHIAKWHGVQVEGGAVTWIWLKPQRRHHHHDDHLAADDEENNDELGGKKRKLVSSQKKKRRVVVTTSYLRGELNQFALRRLDRLFPKLKALVLHHQLRGDFIFGRLPPRLERLDLSSVRSNPKAQFALTGHVPTETLPISLRHLVLQNNDFSGEISWAGLERLHHLEELWLGGCAFLTGSVDFSRLQHLRELKYVSLEKTKFSASDPVPLAGLPAMVTRLILRGVPGVRFVGDVNDFKPVLDEESLQALADIEVISGGKLVKGDAFYRAVLKHRKLV